MGWLDKIKNAMSSDSDVEFSEDYVELEADVKGSSAKVLVRPFVLTAFEDTKPVLDAIRGGNTIAMVNIGPLRDRDMSALKRSIEKIKKTVEANGGDLAGFSENLIILTPSFAKVHREPQKREEPVHDDGGMF